MGVDSSVWLQAAQQVKSAGLSKGLPVRSRWEELGRVQVSYSPDSEMGKWARATVARGDGVRLGGWGHRSSDLHVLSLVCF